MTSHYFCACIPDTSPPRRNQNSRRGFGLIDMISVIGLVGLLLSLSAAVLNRAYSAHSKALAHFRQMQHLQNAQQRFLYDCHDSVSVDVADGLALSSANGSRISYAIQDSRLVRSVEVDGKAFSHEQWQLPAACNASWTVERSEQVPIVSCVLTFTETPKFQPVEWLSRCEFQKIDIIEAAQEEIDE